jgi:hypothetical protein
MQDLNMQDLKYLSCECVSTVVSAIKIAARSAALGKGPGGPLGGLLATPFESVADQKAKIAAEAAGPEAPDPSGGRLRASAACPVARPLFFKCICA